MSTQAVHSVRIVCDSCGARHEVGDHDATSARISANRDGWKYVTWDIRGLGLQRRRPIPKDKLGDFKVDTVPTQWDCCPACPAPESPTEAQKIRDDRKTRNGSGKWVDKEPA